jgi:RNA polymerase sigma-70 factor (ECF subfamily)
LPWIAWRSRRGALDVAWTAAERKDRAEVTALPATTRPQAAGEPRAGAQDADLIARMTRGDRAALAELYGRHAQTLLAVAHGFLRDRQESEDLLHDVFLEAWRSCADYSIARSSVRSWLLLRTRSRALDRLRGRTRRKNIAAVSDTATTSTTTYDMDYDKHRLPAALAQISEPQQGVIMLAYYEGLSTTEIASRLGIPAGTVKSRTHAALKTLRSVLGIADE